LEEVLRRGGGVWGIQGCCGRGITLEIVVKKGKGNTKSGGSNYKIGFSSKEGDAQSGGKEIEKKKTLAGAGSRC